MPERLRAHELWDGDARLLEGAVARNMRAWPSRGTARRRLRARRGGLQPGSGRAVPDTDGIIVAAGRRCSRAYLGWAEEQVRKDHLKRERRRIGRCLLVTKVLTRARLEAEYGK